MELPIDGRRAPFREKYLEDETAMLSKWYAFGRDEKDGTVFVIGGENGNQDIFCGLTEEQARQIIDIRERFTNDILAVLNGRIK